MFERFTHEARRVLLLSEEEARLLGHPFVGTEHVLLGLIHQGDGVAAEALESFGVTLEAVRGKVEEVVGPTETSPPGRKPFTPRAKRLLELSLREALQVGDNYVGTEHLLLGLLREGAGAGYEVLGALEVDPERLRAAVLDLANPRVRPGGASPAVEVRPRPPRPHAVVRDVPGNEVVTRVVRVGRSPAAYDRAYEALAGVVRRIGLPADVLANHVVVESVETADGPGLALSLTHWQAAERHGSEAGPEGIDEGALEGADGKTGEPGESVEPGDSAEPGEPGESAGEG